MRRYSRFAPWINRLVLSVATVIFTAIGLRYITDPVGASAATGAALNSALAITTARIGFGAFPLSFALFSSYCLLSRQRLRTGVSLVTTVLTTAIVVRLISTLADGAAPQSVRLFIPEAAILVLSIGGLMLSGSKSELAKGGVA
jgi:hypothetical protein